MVVKLGNVDLCVCWKNCAPQTCSDKRRNGKYGFQRCVVDITAPVLLQRAMGHRCVHQQGSKRSAKREAMFEKRYNQLSVWLLA